ncbi:hypothetical protein [Actinocorallia populi]|uniref:hypothetical protein n=1 Tax=Actinocorallia populi TaxID=2079200 RepID=UPI000D095A64|nr:hypothetical protein [Actinocorallia populi]
MIRKVALLAVAGSLALTGCGTGNNAESSKPSQLTEGVNLSQNGIDVRNLFVLGPAPGAKLPIGSSLSVYGSLINNGSGQSDALTGVTVADGMVELGTVKGGAVELPRHTAVDLSKPAAGPAGSATPAPTRMPSQAPTGQAAEQEGGSAVVLKNTKQEFLGGEYLRLTLQFRDAQAIKVTVQVIPAHGEFSTLAPATVTTPSPSQSSAPAGEHGDEHGQTGDHAETGVEATPAANPTASKKPRNGNKEQEQEQHEN